MPREMSAGLRWNGTELAASMAKSTVSHRGQVLVLCGAWGFQDFKKVIHGDTNDISILGIS